MQVVNLIAIRFGSLQFGHAMKANCRSRDMLNFQFLESVSLPHFVYIFFLRKNVLMLYYNS